MEMNKLIEKYTKNGFCHFKLKLQALTPLAIRTGETLSPLTDFHIENGRIYYLNSDQLLNYIADKEYLNDFEAKVFEYSGDHSGGSETGAIKKNRFIADFFKEHKDSIQPFLKDCPVERCLLKNDDPWIRLQQVVKGKSGAYIPASSIKGAIRTAIMYYWLSKTEEGKDRISSFVSCIDQKLKTEIEDRNQLGCKVFKAKEGGRDVDELREKLKTIEIENKKFLISRFESFESEISNSIFGDSDGKYSASSFFKIEDSTSFSDNNLLVTSLQKKYRENEGTRSKRKKEFIPTLQELINVGSEAQICVSIPNLPLDKMVLNDFTSFIKTLDTKKGLKTLFGFLRQFSQEYLELEIARLDGFKEEGKDNKKGQAYAKSGLENYHRQLKELQKALLSLKDNEAIISIGFGKSIFLNTVMMALNKTNRDAFRNMVRVLHPHHPANKYFPISYYIASIDSKDYPLGWIKITDENEKAYKEKIDLPDYKIEDLHEGDEIGGVLIERGSMGKVQISLNGVPQTVNANGLSKYEKQHSQTLKIDHLYSFQISVIKDSIIKEIKII